MACLLVDNNQVKYIMLETWNYNKWAWRKNKMLQKVIFLHKAFRFISGQMKINPVTIVVYV